ncbi:Recombinational DNA repair protein (RecE pathway) [Lysinibacillus capsici]|uniref:Recombinational DNA repair protein (RecE pathway) n=1 Tax=Lysinibacillus capsici TaxID=2115968 RepID=A0A2X0X9E2_9BACI|nr:RecT family recombinase [Lysinibacillus capsici]SPT95585.1 Recombinational DNA repair protein (RecE pathway) [Lysinibacillus capsici]
MNRNLPTLTPEITEAFQPAVLQVIRNSIAPTANDQEFLLFAHKAASYGLDPFKNEIFFIKYGSQARIQFAAEAYLSKAREQEGFIPPDTQMVHENDEFKIAMNKETKQMEVVQHEIGFPRGKIIGAYSVAYREGYPPVTVIMDIDEVAHMFTGQNKDNWNKWTSDMFGKHVQQRALKKQYGLSFEDVTISQNDVPQPTTQTRRDITPTQEQIEAPIEQPVLTRSEELLKEVKAKFKQLGITTKKAMQEYLDKNAPGIDPTTATESELVGLIELLNMNIEMLASQSNDADLLE